MCAAAAAADPAAAPARSEVLILLRNSSNPQAEYIIRVVKRWVKEQGLGVDTDV